MAIGVRGVSVPQFSTGNIAVNLIAGLQTGDMMVCYYGTKPWNDAPTIDQGWTDLGETHNGTVAAGVDVGAMQSRIFYKIITGAGGSEVNPTITNSTNNVSGCYVIVFTKGASDTWVTPVATGGGDISAGTGFSCPLDDNIDISAGDFVVVGCSFRSDAATPVTANVDITAPGCTFTDTKTPTTDPETTSGGDMGMSGEYAECTAGPSSGVATISATLAAAHTGSTRIARLRVSTAGPVTVTMGVASLALATFAPTVQTPVLVTPSTAALTTTTFAPTVSTPVLVTMNKATLTTVSFEPSVLIPITIVMGAASLALTTFEMIIVHGIAVVMGTATLTTSTFAPSVTVTDHKLVTMNVAALTLTTFAPTVSTPVAITMGVASLTITRFAPSIVVNTIVVMGRADLVTTTFAPTVSTPVVVIMGVASLVTATFAPSVLVTVLVVMGPAALSTTTFAPTVLTPVVVTMNKLSVVTTTFIPTVIVGTVVTMNKATLTLTTFAPNVLTPVVSTLSTAPLVLQTFAPSVLVPITVTMSPAVLALTTFAPTITAAVTVTMSTAALVITRFAPDIQLTGQVTVVMGTASLTITTYAPSVGGVFTDVTAVVTRRSIYSAIVAPSHTGTYRNAVLQDAAVGYWRLGQTVGTMDDEVGTKHGTVFGGLVRGVAGAIVDPDLAAQFDGIDDYIQVANDPLLYVGLGSKTWELWFKTSQTVRQGLLRHSGNSNAGGVLIDLSAGGFVGVLKAIVSNNNIPPTVSVAISSTGIYNDDLWHHAVIVLDRVTNLLHLYVDGRSDAIPVSAAGLAGVDMLPPANMWFAQVGGAFLNGRLDEISIYSKALLPARVDDHYYIGKGYLQEHSAIVIRRSGYTADLSVVEHGNTEVTRRTS